MNARALSASVLLRVWDDGAYAAAALSKALDDSHLESRDRGLATEITYGVLRSQGYLQRRISAFGKVKAHDAEVLAHLLVAVYQIDFLTRVPPSAAVNEAVTLIREGQGARLAGFANAVLRKIVNSAEEKSSTLQEAILQSSPSWLRKRLLRDVGEEAALAILAPERSPSSSLRLTVPPSAELSLWLEKNASPWPGVPEAYRYTGGGDPRKYEAYARGEFVVQELGAQLVARALGTQPGDAVLDLCAGRGQKTSLLAAQVGEGGRVVATDLHEHKLRALDEEMKRLGVSVSAQTWDWTEAPPPEMTQAFDRVLVDAPCTGVGTVSRRPEILRRLGPGDPVRLSELQLSIARNGVLALKAGGVLLFATCSVLKEEGEKVAEALCSEGLVAPVVPATDVDGALFCAGVEASAHFRLLPQTHGTDGYFVTRLLRLPI